jgi:hypothetical protein
MRRLLPLLAATLLMAASCGGGGGDDGNDAGGSEAPRPSSPATVTILAPKEGAVVSGAAVVVKTELEGGKVVQPSVTKITPTTGHIHLLVDGKVVSMDFGLSHTLHDLEPGTHTLHVEFVAADHLPFDPRVFDEIALTVKG